jgi:hypothetical protein
MGFKPKENTPPMEKELMYLLYDLCVIWGFCIPQTDFERIAKLDKLNAKEFAQQVLTAEGMDSPEENEWQPKIAERFIERFGADQISADTFIDRIKDKEENWS